ncbi:MAG: hypothetical protein HZA54_12060, partial [Planctomycetes bacterium]|nr:hypothetical protein [Planctomycetota bacterium]
SSGAAPAPAAPVTPEEAVRGRTATFLERLAVRDYAGLWALYDDELRERAGSEAEFLRHMKKQEAKPGLAQVLGSATRRLDDVTIDGERARAKVTLIVPERGPEEHIFEWRRDAESGEWCFLGEIAAERESGKE